MSDELLNWRVGSQIEFDALKAFGAPPGPELACRRSPTDSPWGRAQDFNMGRSLVDAGLAEQQRFRRMSNTDKLAVALRGAVNSLPSQFRDKAQELLDPANLAIMAGALAIWVGAHATPVGWIVDIGMVGLGVVALGVEAVAVAREIQAFAQGVIKAQNEGDLIAAGRHLGQAVAIVGVDVVVALLLKKAVVKVREPKLRLTQEAPAQRLLFGKYDPGKAQARLAPEVVEATSPQAAKRPTKTKIGPSVPDFHARNFNGGVAKNRQVSGDEIFYKYHGTSNRYGRTHNYVTKKQYSSETQLRNDLAILDEWGIDITHVTAFKPAKGTWVSEGTAAPQTAKFLPEHRPGGGYQGLIEVNNLPNSSIIKTEKIPSSWHTQ